VLPGQHKSALIVLMATALYLPACPPFLCLWHFLIGHTGQEAKLFLVAAAAAAREAGAARGQCLAADLQEKRSRRLTEIAAGLGIRRCSLCQSAAQSPLAAAAFIFYSHSHELVCMPRQHLLP
jgi:hypothetical protein